ncbi:hypothetical protein M885DRAFT_33253 [Pelagophyceae sp. CCMP2097]|nr:hypothetical protein M885DRAFT_33253 [Pelagophyceae sp. CCMP2097]
MQLPRPKVGKACTDGFLALGLMSCEAICTGLEPLPDKVPAANDFCRKFMKEYPKPTARRRRPFRPFFEALGQKRTRVKLFAAAREKEPFARASKPPRTATAARALVLEGRPRGLGRGPLGRPSAERVRLGQRAPINVSLARIGPSHWPLSTAAAIGLSRRQMRERSRRRRGPLLRRCRIRWDSSSSRPLEADPFPRTIV